MNSLEDLFLLDPSIHFLNHGSFGACPRPVFAAYQAWQRRLEEQPVRFLGREFNDLMRFARQALGDYLHARADDLVFVPNATHAVNIVARSLPLQPGDEVLATDHEYGACDYTWQFVTQKAGALYRRQPLGREAASAAELAERIWAGVTERTRLIFLSHITSPTALHLPVEDICRRARKAGILTLVDGAHAPGQIELHLERLGADFYAGNCHKWMLAPKGAGFLHARSHAQALLQPLVVSWGCHPAPDFTTGSRFVDLFQWLGTRDPAAALSVSAAIAFMGEHNWPAVRRCCHHLLGEALEEIHALTGLPPLYASAEGYAQMAAAELPPAVDGADLKRRLYDDYRVEAPVTALDGRQFVRVSVQGYNTRQDVDALLAGLKALL